MCVGLHVSVPSAVQHFVIKTRSNSGPKNSDRYLLIANFVVNIVWLSRTFGGDLTTFYIRPG